MKTFSKNKTISLKWLILFGLIGFLAIPLPQYKPKYSKALYSKEGTLLSATVSANNQWCFPLDEKLPENFKHCVIIYEDEYFPYHFGCNPISILKALFINHKKAKIVRGASTIPMQVMRMKNQSRNRSWYNKLMETIQAIKYSFLHTDQTILREWAEMAPFGGNTIGAKAASLRYFGRTLDNLSWAEYALLAVMPNGPSSASLTKNRESLRKKRNFLLKKLHKKGFFDQSELHLYEEEDLPTTTKSIPQQAYHLLQLMSKKHPEVYVFHSTVPEVMQSKIYDLLEREASFLIQEDIRNHACVVIDVQNNELMSYHGNISGNNQSFSYVDIVQSPRSYGSLLKPILYAHALETGQFLPNELVADIPTAIGEFQPENFDKKYRGAVPFEEVIIQSLNVPSVRVLNTSGLQKFYELLKKLEFTHLNKGADHYGLSIILGGGEATLWDLCRVYKGLAQNFLNHTDAYKEVQCLQMQDVKSSKSQFAFSQSSLHATIQAMADVSRPREEKSWEQFGIEHKIAWKTGTSFGHKDAWALGFNGKYMVGIWIGNEGGEGRFDLTGISKAAPLMFKVFNLMPENQWFKTSSTSAATDEIRVCSASGKLAGPLCKDTYVLKNNRTSFQLQPCNFHQIVRVNDSGLAISENCNQDVVFTDTLFVLPSMMEYYYRQSHVDYKGLPPNDPSCPSFSQLCKIIYPQNGLKVFLPKEKIDLQNDLIVKAYHREKDSQLFWFLDDKYVNITKNNHNIQLKLSKGKHVLTISDPYGYQDQIVFEILASP